MKGILTKIVILVLILLGQIQLVTAYFTDFIPWNFLIGILLCIGGFHIVFATIIFDLVKKTKLTKKWTIPILISLVIGLFVGWGLSKFQNKERTENAEKIIAALEKYKIDQGVYPLKQEDLTPKYLKSIPTSNWGFQSVSFDYETNSARDEFGLEYKVTFGAGYYYHSSMKEWQFWD